MKRLISSRERTPAGRLFDRCHIIEANGESYRLRQARMEQKLPPLPI